MIIIFNEHLVGEVFLICRLFPDKLRLKFIKTCIQKYIEHLYNYPYQTLSIWTQCWFLSTGHIFGLASTQINQPLDVQFVYVCSIYMCDHL